MQKFLTCNNRYYFLFLCFLSFSFAYLGNRFLYTDSLYYSTLNERFTDEQIKILLNIRGKWTNISYLLIPVFIIIRVLYTSFCLFLGDLFQESHWGYKRMFNIALKIDFIFVLSAICIFCYHILFGTYETVDDLSVNPFSILAFMGNENIPNWLVFAYNSINLFELIYLVFMTLLIHFSMQAGYMKALIFSLLTYGLGNYLYVVSITFLYLNFS